MERAWVRRQRASSHHHHHNNSNIDRDENELFDRKSSSSSFSSTPASPSPPPPRRRVTTPASSLLSRLTASTDGTTSSSPTINSDHFRPHHTAPIAPTVVDRSPSSSSRRTSDAATASALRRKSFRTSRRSWTETRSFSKTTSRSKSTQALISDTRSAHISGASSSSIVFGLLLGHKRSKWHMRGPKTTWVPRRFEIAEGALKIFEHGAEGLAPESTIHLASCQIHDVVVVPSPARFSLSPFSSSEDVTIAASSDAPTDRDALIQCHRALRLAAVSPTFISRRHLRYDERKDVLGKGGSGVVYVAEYFGTKVALKRLYAASSSSSMPLGRLQQQQQRQQEQSTRDPSLEELVKELRLLGRFRHPHVISFLGICFDPFHASSSSSSSLSAVSMVMEYCPFDLETLIHDRRHRHRWTRRKFVGVVSGITCGMAFLHNHGVIHRDLKPQNLMLTDSLKVKIVDFGVSRLYASRRKTMTGYVGTPAYMSPELIQGKPYDGCADVFSFGIILHEMWTGQRPYREIKQQFTMMRRVCQGYRMATKGWPKALAEFVGRCWHRDPQLRPTFGRLDTTWRSDAIQREIQLMKDSCWFARRRTRGASSTKTTTMTTTVTVPTSPPTSPPPVGSLRNPAPLVIRMKRDPEGRVGITFDTSLRVLTVTDWARRYGLKEGQRIVKCEGRAVEGSKEKLVAAIPKDPFRTIRLEVTDGDAAAGVADPLFVQCRDGPLALNELQMAWFRENMRPESIRRTTDKALLMAMLVQLQA